MNKLVFEGFTVLHKVNRKLKHSYISIKNDEVVLKTPNVSSQFVQDILESKRSWILKQLKKAQANKPTEIRLKDELLLFGKVYPIDSPIAISLQKKLVKIRILSQERVIKAYDTFYKESALEYITSRVEYFSKIMGYGYKEIKYRKMRSRWGSCSSSKILTFNTELMKVRTELIDYVVVHELAHLKHMNHSPDFHRLVDFYLPNSKKYKDELKNTKIATF